MSEENRPNLHAVGLTMDIIDAIDKRRRGNASSVNLGKIIDAIRPDLLEFVEHVDIVLDRLAQDVGPQKGE